jgi:hypothetical protein
MLYVLPEIKLEQVDSVYIGKPGRCMCGCSGNYTYTKANQEWSGKHRGYAVDDEAVNDKRVQYVISKIAKNAAAGIECTQDYIYQQVIGQTQYDIYLKQK